MLVDGLEQAGPVERTADPSDRRSKVITETAAGVRLYKKAGAVTAEGGAVTMSKLSAAEQETLRELLSSAAFLAS